MSITPTDEHVSPEMQQLIDGDLIRILSSREPRVLRKDCAEGIKFITTSYTAGVTVPRGAVNDEAVSEPVVSEVVEMLEELGFNENEANTIIRRVGTSGPDRMQQMQW